MNEPKQAEPTQRSDPKPDRTLTALISAVFFGAIGALIGFQLGKIGANPLEVTKRVAGRLINFESKGGKFFLGFGHMVMTIGGGLLGAIGAAYSATVLGRKREQPRYEAEQDPQATVGTALQEVDAPNVQMSHGPQTHVKESQHHGSMQQLERNLQYPTSWG